MARTTDTERGARIALALAEPKALQPDLFADAIPADYWHEIASAARDALAECTALKEARA